MPGPDDEEDDDELEGDEDDDGGDDDESDDDDDDDVPLEPSEMIERIVDALDDMEGIDNAEIIENSAEVTMDDESVWRITVRKVR